MKPGVLPRLRAARVVGRVIREGAWTAPAIAAEAGELEPVDRQMMEALAFGTIRRLATLDAGISQVSDRPVAEISPPVLDQLRVGVFELWYGRSRPSAVVDTAVEAIRAQEGRAGAFVNALLRKVSQIERPLDRASRLALPGWLLEVLDEGWGFEETDAFALASLEPAPVSVRARPGRPRPLGEPFAGIAGSYVVAPGALGGHPLADPSSVAVVESLQVSGDMRVADLAAAPGGKTMDIADRLLGRGLVVATDRHRRRGLRAARRVPTAHWVIADSTSPPWRVASFDRVLVDAPCSGLGTLRRRPEIRHRVTPAEIKRLAAQQQEMIRAGLRLLVPGGKLVYSVCTVTAAETVDQVADLNPVAGPPAPGLPGRQFGGGWLLAPHLTGSDGMFIAIIGKD